MNLSKDIFPNGDALIKALNDNTFANNFDQEPEYILNENYRSFDELFCSEQEVAIQVINRINNKYNKNINVRDTHSYLHNGNYFTWQFSFTDKSMSPDFAIENVYVIDHNLNQLHAFGRAIRINYSINEVVERETEREDERKKMKEEILKIARNNARNIIMQIIEDGIYPNHNICRKGYMILQLSNDESDRLLGNRMLVLSSLKSSSQQ